MSPASQWTFGPFRLDSDNACLWQGEQMIALRPKVYAVLAYLVQHAGQLVTKETLLNHVWPETAVSDAVLKVCIAQLRKTFGETAQTAQFIVTVHRQGYRFIAPVTTLESPDKEPSTHLGSALPTPLPSPKPPDPSPSFDLIASRETELSQLHQWFGTVVQGKRQIAFITGEAGIGKTTLVDAFVAQLTQAETDAWIGYGQCIEQYGSGEAYLPLLEALEQLCHSRHGARVIDVLHRQAPNWLLQMPSLLSADDGDALRGRCGGTTRERMIRELAEALETLTVDQPLVLILEDLHWSDVSTLDWLAYAARRRSAARLFILGTYRPVDAILRAHPLRTLAQELQRQHHGVELTLEYLSTAEVIAYLEHRFNRFTHTQELGRLIHQRTNGNPLFMVNVAEDIVRHGILREEPGGWQLVGDVEAVARSVPENLRQLIEQQVEELPPDEQELLYVASVAGMEFSAAAVAAGVDRSIEDVEAACDPLARRGQLIRPRGIAEWADGTVSACYGFIHALYQDILYHRIPASRRARWHQQMGLRIEHGYESRQREIAVELAEHFVRGRDPVKAVHYLRYAGENALQRSAHQEALSHLHRALDRLAAWPDTPERVQQELDIQLALGAACIATQGYAAPEVEQAYTQARKLCQRLGEATPQLFTALVGLRRFYQVRADYPASRELGERLLTIARQRQDPALLLEAYFGVAITAYYQGDFTISTRHCEHGIDLYDRHRGQVYAYKSVQDPGVVCQILASLGLWIRGYPERAIHHSCAGIALARELAHPFSLAFALLHGALLYVQRREIETVHEMAEEGLAIGQERGFAFWVAWGMFLRGWTLVQHGNPEAGLADMHRGLADMNRLKARVGESIFLTLLAESYAQTGRPEEGLRVINEARTTVNQLGERCYEAETCRVKGELLLQLPGRHEAEAAACLAHALEVAQEQEAKAWELRTAMSLGHLPAQHQRPEDTLERLRQVYTTFTEGFETADLQAAQLLLT